MKPGVGNIGLGIMGKRMAENLLKAGFSLSVWNRTRAKAEGLRQAGARLASTPREAAASSDFLLTVVSDPPALEQVFGEPMAPLKG
jgi:3-hydroxyisobutyrate dehydrogenase-like beta-hydroxyacid dehydrogenase